MPNTPAISVVIVSDYAAGGPVSARDIRAALSALARQDIEEPVEFLFIESECFRDDLPEDVASILPGLKTLFLPERESYPLKNHGATEFRISLQLVLNPDRRVDQGGNPRATGCSPQKGRKNW